MNIVPIEQILQNAIQNTFTIVRVNFTFPYQSLEEQQLGNQEFAGMQERVASLVPQVDAMAGKAGVVRLREELADLQNKIAQFPAYWSSKFKGWQEDPRFPITLQRTDYPHGYLFTPVNNSADGAPPIQSTQAEIILRSLMEVVNSYLQQQYFSLKNAAGQAVTTAAGETILQEMLRLDLFDMEYLGFDPNNRNQELIANFGLRINYPAHTGRNLNPDHGFPFNFLHRSELGLWVPNVLPHVYTALEDGGARYYQESPGTPILAAALEKSNQIPIYKIDPNQILSQTGIGESVHSGAGGGAMRTDRPTESEYHWMGPRALGYGLGLDLDRWVTNSFINETTLRQQNFRQSPLPTPPLFRTKEPAQNMSCEIRYFKRFTGTEGAAKKNTPKLTQPRKEDLFFVKEQAGTANTLRKKQKGTWIFGEGGVIQGTSGVVLRHENSRRDQAGSVMRQAFQDRGITAPGINLGSATQFANFVAANDDTLRAFWHQQSANIQPFANSGLTEPQFEALKLRFRTDQEWCHLYGHGDGGSEEFSNFISGSKHCNSYQLGIETGQRAGRLPGLSAKITGYLMPNSAHAIANFGEQELAFLASFGNAFIVADDVEGTRDKILDFINNFNDSADFSPHLPPFHPEAKYPPLVMAQEAYLSLGQDSRSRYIRRLKSFLKSMVLIDYPIGNNVRYKVYSDNVKVLDIGFPAQLESLDYNEYKLIETTVRRVILTAKGNGQTYLQSIHAKIQSRLQSETDPRIHQMNLQYQLP